VSWAIRLVVAPDLKAVQSIFDRVESRPERYELNLYITGTDEDNAPVESGDLLVGDRDASTTEESES